MALLRKDIKIGFLTGGALLALGAGYVLVMSLTGSASADSATQGFDPLGDPLASVMAEPAGESVVDAGNPPSLSATTTTTTTEPRNDGFADVWGDLGEPVVTRTPSGSGGGDMIEEYEEAFEAAPAVANLNQPEFNEFGNFPTADSTPHRPQASFDTAPTQANTAAAPDLTTGGQTHVVRTGDNVSVIAEEYLGDANLFQAILDANPGLDPRRMKVGQVLQIPAAHAARQHAEATAPVGGGATHTVAAGDTLSRIASRRLGRSALWEDIYELNRDVIGDDPANLKVGMVLRLPQ